MKTTLWTLLLSAILLWSCADTPNSPIESGRDSYQLIKLPPKSGLSVETIFSKTELIDGEEGGEILIKEVYIAADGHEVKIDAKLDIPQNAFTGVVYITFSIDDEYAAASFSPHMVFDEPVKLQMKFDGMDLKELNLKGQNYDFIYIDDNGKTETVEHAGIKVDNSGGQITLSNAFLNHFSRYCFTR